MALLKPLVRASGSSGSNATSYTTAESFTPNRGSALLAFINTHGMVDLEVPVDATLTGGGVDAWLPVDSLHWNINEATEGRIQVFKAVFDEPGAASTVLIDFGAQTQNSGAWSIIEVPYADFELGTPVKDEDGASTNMSATATISKEPSSFTIGVLCNTDNIQPAVPTSPAVSLSTTAWSNPTNSMNVAYSEENSIEWTWDNERYGYIAFEVKESTLYFKPAEFSQSFNDQNESYVGTAPYAEGFNEQDNQFLGLINEFEFGDFGAGTDETYVGSGSIVSGQYGFSDPFNPTIFEFSPGEGSFAITQPFNEGFFMESQILQVIDSDSFTASESESLSAGITSTESASGSDNSASVFAEVDDSDAGILSDNASPAIAFTAPTETASALETESAFRESAYFFEDEYAYALDEESLEAFFVQTDSGSGIEADFYIQTPQHIESFIYEETQSVGADIQSEDSAVIEETESLNVLESEQAFAVETETVEVLIQSSDDASGNDAQQVNAGLTSSDSFSSEEQDFLPAASIESNDVVNYVEDDTVAADVSSTESITLTHLIEFGLMNSDSFTASESESLEASISAEDDFGGEDTEILLLLGQLSQDTDPYYPAVLNSRPRNYWRFGSLNGNIIPDKMRKNDGVYYGTIDATRGVVAGKNTAIYFDGTESIRFGDVELPSRIAFELWIEDAQGVVIQKEEEFKAEITGSIMTFEVYDIAGDVVFLHEVDITGKKYIVWNISEEMSQVYVDAKLHSEILAIGTVRPNTSNTLSAATDFIAANNFTGVMDELAIYDRILLPAEVLAHWNAGNRYQSYETAATGYNSMIYVPGYEKADFNHEYTVLNETTSLISGPQKENSGALDGLIEFEGSSELLTTTLNTATVGFWFRSDEVGWKHPVVKGGTGDEFSIKIDDSDNIIINAGGQSRVHSAGPTLSDGLWHHIVVSFGPAGNIIYHNGVAVDSSATLGAFSTPDGSIILNSENNSAIADFFFTWREITAPEAKQLYEISYYGRHDLSVNDQTPPSISEGQTDIYVFDKQLAGT